MTARLALVTVLVQTLGTTIAVGVLELPGYALLIVSGLALIDRGKAARVPARPDFPRSWLGLTAAAFVGYHVLGYPTGLSFLAPLIAAIIAIKAGRHRLVWTTTSISYAVWLLLATPKASQAWAVLAWIVGIGLFVEFVLTAARVGSRMAREQKRLHEERRLRQASEERLRIAQELHDVLGHHLSLINVRASVGRHLLDREPEQARAALDTIKDASAEALREVQSVLNALYPTGQAAPRAPAPQLSQLDALTSDAGLPVHTTISGEPVPLPAEIDRAAYRIVQEALTNVRRHAGPGAKATITIEYQREELTVQVDNDGGLIPLSNMEGNGISGMRERATTLGGSLTAGPLPSGGWRVRATLPLGAQ